MLNPAEGRMATNSRIYLRGAVTLVAPQVAHAEALMEGSSRDRADLRGVMSIGLGAAGRYTCIRICAGS